MIDPKKDFQDFLNTKSSQVSPELDERVLSYVRNDLNPTHMRVFIKLLGIQMFIGVVTLLFCPQFDLSLTNNHQMFHYFHHRFGAKICMLICGAIFIGSGAVFSSYLLSVSEVKKIMRSRFLYFMSVSMIALFSLYIFGASIYIVSAIYWLLGAAMSGVILFELNRIIKWRLI